MIGGASRDLAPGSREPGVSTGRHHPILKGDELAIQGVDLLTVPPLGNTLLHRQ